MTSRILGRETMAIAEMKILQPKKAIATGFPIVYAILSIMDWVTMFRLVESRRGPVSLATGAQPLLGHMKTVWRCGNKGLPGHSLNLTLTTLVRGWTHEVSEGEPCRIQLWSVAPSSGVLTDAIGSSIDTMNGHAPS
jgi:hypothetical protein